LALPLIDLRVCHAIIRHCVFIPSGESRVHDDEVKGNRRDLDLSVSLFCFFAEGQQNIRGHVAESLAIVRTP
jgi:hypothetical protein